jgi:hypothetical protein
MIRNARVIAVGVLVTLGVCPASAQDAWPEVLIGGVDRCDAMPGIGLFHYQSRDPGERWNRYILGDTCYSPEGGWFVGPEVLEGLELVQDYGMGSAGFAILSDADQQHRRRRLSTNALSGPGGEVMLPVRDVVETVVVVPDEFIEAVPAAEALDGYGYAFSTPRADISGFPDGLWVADIAGQELTRLEGEEAVEPTGVVFGYSMHLLRAEAGQLIYLGPGQGQEPASFNLQLEAGRLGGAFAVNGRNPVRPEARSPRDYDTATLELGWVNGRAIEADGAVIVVAVGVGRSLLRDQVGTTNTEDGWARLVLQPVPAEIPRDMLGEFFDVAPGDL